ncbi:winged helix-turn-helix transcriptional regulator [Larkinella sp. VNQ87]|uniref:winged helix-turn-helix transcriptional regulator n=1 Tax=Larkinella sp. VNQ87 TaxID=3400921 RepID=UPI003C018321
MEPTYCTTHLRSMADTLDIIGGKWKLLVLTFLESQTAVRFNEIQRAVTNITPRMLSKELKELEQNELIERRVYPTMPVSVDYRLTDYGRSLDQVLFALGDWGKNHRKRIMRVSVGVQEPVETV